ncbi:uncharacterized protein BJ171DRAFT_486470 [Polychytrium aggregatum]|uniref:uncharacterized protein n=1 Tax=Polychytrium aggregatum TaxID=110093 RepID=UPI0022FE6CDF|nr:uncharacterized protein BJ171DRAFT_486470 [Polychytrium aggregatum]KAI9209329.1 hypothetical protein BJ171DRAFT_486470 [Polychytrium aggregatum]
MADGASRTARLPTSRTQGLLAVLPLKSSADDRLQSDLLLAWTDGVSCFAALDSELEVIANGAAVIDLAHIEPACTIAHTSLPRSLAWLRDPVDPEQAVLLALYPSKIRSWVFGPVRPKSTLSYQETAPLLFMSDSVLTSCSCNPVFPVVMLVSNQELALYSWPFQDEQGSRSAKFFHQLPNASLSSGCWSLDGLVFVCISGVSAIQVTSPDPSWRYPKVQILTHNLSLSVRRIIPLSLPTDFIIIGDSGFSLMLERDDIVPRMAVRAPIRRSSPSEDLPTIVALSSHNEMLAPVAPQQPELPDLFNIYSSSPAAAPIGTQNSAADSVLCWIRFPDGRTDGGLETTVRLLSTLHLPLLLIDVVEYDRVSHIYVSNNTVPVIFDIKCDLTSGVLQQGDVIDLEAGHVVLALACASQVARRSSANHRVSSGAFPGLPAVGSSSTHILRILAGQKKRQGLFENQLSGQGDYSLKLIRMERTVEANAPPLAATSSTPEPAVSVSQIVRLLERMTTQLDRIERKQNEIESRLQRLEIRRGMS